MPMILTATTLDPPDLPGRLGRSGRPDRWRLLPWRLLDRLVEADARHRERCKLARMPPERLRDMGIPACAATGSAA